MRQKIALFGEAEKGEYSSLLHIKSVLALSEILGNPPEHSQGIQTAIQSLLYDREIIYIRVREEGYSTKDYFKGLNLLETSKRIKNLMAICLPGVGDSKIIDASAKLCKARSSLLVLSEHDLYDYLTEIHLPPIN